MAVDITVQDLWLFLRRKYSSIIPNSISEGFYEKFGESRRHGKLPRRRAKCHQNVIKLNR